MTDDNFCDCGMVGYKYGIGNCPNCDDVYSMFDDPPREEEAPSGEGRSEQDSPGLLQEGLPRRGLRP